MESQENDWNIMTGHEAALAAAGVKPSQRTDAEKAAYANGSGDQRVRNADHEAARKERINGKK